MGAPEKRGREGDHCLVIAVSPFPLSPSPPPSLTPDRLGGLDEFPSGFDPRWGGRKRDGSQRKQLTQVWGVRLPGGCLTSTSGGLRCPGAAGNPRWDLTSLYGKELGTGILHPGPCIPHPGPCILHLGSMYLDCHIPASRIPALASYTLQSLSLHPGSLQPTSLILHSRGDAIAAQGIAGCAVGEKV